MFLACALGAGLGCLISLEFSPEFCWVGFIIGGIVGYLSYEFKNVLKAIGQAYKGARGYKFPENYLSLVLLMGLFFASVAFYSGCAASAIVFLASWNPNDILKAFALCYAIYGAVLFFTSFVIITTSPRVDESEVVEWKESAYKASPHRTIYLALLYLLMGALFVFSPKGWIWAWKVICRFCAFTKRFSWRAFLLIHSQVRLICGTDAMIGAAIGYFYGSALIGALAGGLIGVFNYKVVTECILMRFGYVTIKK